MKTLTKLVFIVINIFYTSYKCFPQNIDTFGGIGVFGSNGDGSLAILAEIGTPSSLAFDTIGNLYITQVYESRIRMIDKSNIITTIVGSSGGGFSGDGGPGSLAQISSPISIILDKSGNIYFSDQSNQRVRKINSSGIISTIAGNGVQGFSGDGGLATSAKLNFPNGLALDTLGNLYIADSNNFRIRKVDTSGIITTIAGNGQGFSGDGGPATLAQFYYPELIN